MVQVRKLVLAIAAASALSSGMAQALGLGGLTVKSTLNQPLLAEIELTEVQDLSASQVVPSLATSAEFAQAGVGRVAILDDLTFTPVVNPGGKSVLRITSTKPIRDPYVKFLVQVLWPNGRALREYSLLLDPPKFSPQAAAAAAAGSAQLPSTAPNAAPATAPAAEAPAPAPAPSTPAPAPEPKFTQYTTANNDTLWEIAERVKNGGTVQQTMLAIQALNPDAFIAGNINRLKKGQVLRLPSPQESTALAQPRAVAEVAEQNRAWREGRRLPSGARQVDATRRDRTGPSPSQIDAKDSLSLVSANAKPGAKGAASDNADVSTQLATTQESLDSTRRDNAELKSRMTDLQSQVDKLQRLIQLKNDQLAKMQASGAAIPPPVDPANAANPANPAVSPNSVTNPNNAANPAMQAEVVPSAAAPDAAGKAPNEIAPEDALPVDGAAVTSATPDQPLIVPTEPVVDEDNRSALDKILSSPMLMGIIGGGALLVLLLLLLLARRRNALIEAEKHRQMARALSEESDFASDMDMPPSSFEGLETPAPHAKMPPAPTVTEPVREHPADALVQAEIHIAYGRTNQAVAVLEDAIKHEPERSDLRLKLMEVYAEQDNTAGFVAQERQLIATGKNHAEVEELKSRYPSMAAAAAAVAGVAAAAVLASEMDAKYVEDLLHDEPEVAAQPQPYTEVPLDEEFDNAFDLSLDDLDGESAPSASNRAVAQEDATLDDLDLDAPFAGSAADDLDFDAILREQQAASTDAKPADLDDFDLDLSEDQPALKAEDDYLLGMEDDLRDPSPAVPSAEPGATKADAADDIDLPADFDLSLADEMETDQASQAFASEIDDVNAELDRLSQSLEQPPIAKPFDAPPVDSPRFNEQDALLADDEPEFDFLSGTDEAATKLDLARAYIEMGDADGARDILDEVVVEGDDGQKTEARDMLSRLV
jgi:pilus assembly protein FimV